MGELVLSGGKSSDVTVISNLFIDYFMPSASGTYVKIYLYLLRSLHQTGSSLSVSSVADVLDITEKDVLRAFSYWEKRSVLRLSQDSVTNAITGVCLTDLSLVPFDGEGRPIPDAQTVAVPSFILPSCSTADLKSAASETAAAEAAVTVREQLSAVPELTVIAQFPGTDTAEVPNTESSHQAAGRPVFSAEEVQQFTQNDEVQWIMNVVESYMERLLRPIDTQLILYLYETVGFSAELILYLYEYCASKNKKNPSYIEAVAMSWAAQGIDSVEKAEAASAAFHSAYSAVSKAFGLGRQLGTAEQQYADKWLHKYGFDTPFIEEACSRTLLATNRPDFKYADKILENWYKKNIRSLQDIAKLDEVHSQASRNSSVSQIQLKQTTTNKFNAFPQRSYTGEDYSTMEQRLLNRQ